MSPENEVNVRIPPENITGVRLLPGNTEEDAELTPMQSATSLLSPPRRKAPKRIVTFD